MQVIMMLIELLSDVCLGPGSLAIYWGSTPGFGLDERQMEQKKEGPDERGMPAEN